MKQEWAPARDPAASAVWSEVIVPLAATLRDGAGALADSMSERIEAEVPEIFGAEGSAQAARASNEGSLRQIAELIESGADPALVDLPAPTVAYALEEAKHGQPLPGLLRAYRIGHRVTWEWWIEALHERVTDRERLYDATRLVSRYLFDYIDSVSRVGEELYSRERERWLRSAAAAKTELIEALLAEAPIDLETAERRLGYALDRWHIGVVLWHEPDPGDPDSTRALESALTAIAEAIGTRPLIHPLGAYALAAWFGAREEPDEEAIARLGLDPADGVRGSLGERARGTAGFRRTHLEAVHARRVAELTAETGSGLTRYGSVALAAMATVDSDQARMFIERALGELASEDETTRKLADTLAAYLDEGASPGRAAVRLGIHENTVRYRVRQVEDLLGRPVEPSDLELRVALALRASALASAGAAPA